MVLRNYYRLPGKRLCMDLFTTITITITVTCTGDLGKALYANASPSCYTLSPIGRDSTLGTCRNNNFAPKGDSTHSLIGSSPCEISHAKAL